MAGHTEAKGTNLRGRLDALCRVWGSAHALPDRTGVETIIALAIAGPGSWFQWNAGWRDYRSNHYHRNRLRLAVAYGSGSFFKGDCHAGFAGEKPDIDRRRAKLLYGSLVSGCCRDTDARRIVGTLLILTSIWRMFVST